MYILLSAAARLWVNGVPLDWTKFHHGKARRRVSLPSYPFERQRYSAGMLLAAKKRNRTALRTCTARRLVLRSGLEKNASARS